MAQMTFIKPAEPSMTEREPYALASELRFECLPVKTHLVPSWFALFINVFKFPSLPLWTSQVSVNGFSATDTEDCVRS